MIEIDKPKIELETSESEKNYGKFIVEPLERGYGTTLGNSLRRILTSSLPGAAITSIKIDGVIHEFSTIPGVTEDVTEIILNLKRLAVRVDDEEDEYKMTLSVEGPKDITAADIMAPTGVEIFNLSSTLQLWQKTTTSTWKWSSVRGYSLAEQNSQYVMANDENGMAINEIAIDSIFTPVLRR